MGARADQYRGTGTERKRHFRGIGAHFEGALDAEVELDRRAELDAVLARGKGKVGVVLGFRDHLAVTVPDVGGDDLREP